MFVLFSTRRSAREEERKSEFFLCLMKICQSTYCCCILYLLLANLRKRLLKSFWPKQKINATRKLGKFFPVLLSTLNIKMGFPTVALGSNLKNSLLF